jgi:glutaconate CoA-transferase subunit A
MKDAISRFVKVGDTLFLSGTQHGEPTAAVHEIVRQRIDHLTLICCLVATSGLLIAEGLLDKMITAFMVRDEKRSYTLTRARNLKKLPVFEETSHFGICLALLAGQMGIPFIPSRCLIGSDLMKYNENLKTTQCPFTGETLVAVRAVVPDVGILHVQRADAEGNAQKWGSLGVDREGINASKKVIVVTEKIVNSEVIRKTPNLTIIPGFRVNAVVEQLWGAHPLHLAGCYNGDIWGYMADTMGKEKFEAYLEDFVHGVADWNEYLEKRKALKGDAYFEKLKIRDPISSDPIVTGY